MRRSLVESLETRRLLTNVMPAFADKIGLTNLVDPNTTFEDNFEGTSLDHDKWQVREGPRWRKVKNGAISEMSVTGEESIVVRNGNLELIAHTDPVTGQNRAGYIQTGTDFKANQPSNIQASRLMDGYNGNFEQAFGYWEARVKFNSLPGQWSAFWVHSYGMVDVGHDASRINHPEIYGTEYDVAEHGAIRQGASVSNEISTVAHANGYENYQRSSAVHVATSNYSPSYNSPNQFHVYGLLWTSTYAKFYIDGNLVHTETDPAMVSKVPHVAIFSNDIGAGGALFENSGSNFFGNVPANGYGSLDTSTAKLTADYVRVWQLKGVSTPVYGSLAGIVYNDFNSNGTRDTGDSGLSGRVVYIDTNSNSILDATERRATTNASGEYVIGELVPGSYLIRQVVTTGTQTAPIGTAASTVSITANQRAALNFGVGGLQPATSAVVEGRVILDANNNGAFDTGEVGQANANVYIDYNNNLISDADEPQATTNSTGGYRIVAELAGPYAVRLNLTGSNWTQTLPGSNAGRWVSLEIGQARTAEPFAVRPTVVVVSAPVEGRVIRDANNNGLFDAGEIGQANVNVYIDYNNNSVRDDGEPQVATNSAGGYRLVSTRVGSLPVRLNVMGSDWIQTIPASNAARWITFVNGTAKAAEVFGVRPRVIPPTYAIISGTVYTDTNRNGVKDASETGRANVVVYLDANLNGKYDAGETTRTTTSTGAYRFEQVLPGARAVKIVPQTGLTQTQPTNNNAQWINAVAGTTYGDRNFGVYETPIGARVAGVVYNDANQNGSRQDSELGVAGIRVYLDANYNGKLDTGEKTALTNATGAYVFELVPAGNVSVRVALTSDYRQITPTGNGSNWISAVAGGNYTARNFGVSHVAAPAGANTITGNVFGDWNANGTRQTGENGLGGIRVYIDYNLNGKFDAGEPLSVTNASGIYKFEAVRAGNLALRLNLTGANWLQTYPSSSAALWMTFTSGMNLKDKNFMVKPK